MKRRLTSAFLAVFAGLVIVNPAPAQVLMDFGPNDVANGNITTSPDYNGNYWNNITSVANGSSITNLVTTNNLPSTIAITINSASWAENGIQNGGLLNPNPALLGIFAVTNATEDYFFINQNYGSAAATQTFLISGLNPASAYNLSMFGTRNTATPRTTTYSVTDVNGTHSTNLVVSGTASNSGSNLSDTQGNDKTIVSLNGLVPNTAGQLTFSLIVGDSQNFAYLGILLISAAPTPPVFTLQPQSQTDRVGTTNTLTAYAAGNPSYQWYFNNALTNAPVSGATSTNLLLAGVGFTNTGNYYVVASNSLGTATSAVAMVSIVPLHVPAQSVLIDFGPNDGVNGNPTTNPDLNGNYWNNLVSPNTVANGLSLTNLVTANNTPNSLAVTITSSTWSDNGILNGGLLTPNSSLLGDFAVPTVTEDYFFLSGAQGTSGTLQLSGLNPALTYNLSMFGTRNTAGTTPIIRTSAYSVTDANGLHTVSLITSGTNANSGTNPGNTSGNDKTIVSLNGLVPNAAGQINFTLTIADNGGFAYLGAMEITFNDHPPVANNQTYSRNDLSSWKIKVSDLLTNATDVDNQALTLVGVGPSTNGISLVITTNSPAYVEYSNPNLVNDQFSYTVTDGYGGTNSAVITLNAGSSNGTAGQISNVAFTGGVASMTFAGIPGYKYHVQVSTNLTDWSDVLITNAPAGGVFQFNDNAAPTPTAFYRLMWNGN